MISRGGEGSISIFPNPVTESLQIAYQIAKDENFVIKAYSSDGRKVYEYKMTSDADISKVMTIDVSRWNAGVYTIVVSSNGKTNEKKVVKL